MKDQTMKLFETKLIQTASLVVLWAGWAASTRAAALPIVNGSYEIVWTNSVIQTDISGTIAPNWYPLAVSSPTSTGSPFTVAGVDSGGAGPSAGFIPGWQLTAGGGAADIEKLNTTYFFDNHTLVGHLNGSTMSNVLASVLTSNTRYTLSLDIGKYLTGAASSWGASDYSVALLAGGVSLPLVGSNLSPTAGNFTNVVFTYISPFDVTPGQVLSIQLTGLTAGKAIEFDNVALDATVIPEPSTVLLLLGGSGLAVWRRRARNERVARHP